MFAFLMLGLVSPSLTAGFFFYIKWNDPVKYVRIPVRNIDKVCLYPINSAGRIKSGAFYLRFTGYRRHTIG